MRRGLVKRPGEWEWSSYADYAGPEEGLPQQSILRTDRVRLPADEAARI